MELWDVYDMNRNKKNTIMARGDKFKEGDYHLVVHVCIINSKNEMLIQQRSAIKTYLTSLWDFTAGGTVEHGETSQQAGMRETFEELGIKINLEDTLPQFAMNYEKGFDDFYLVKQDVDIKTVTLQTSEVQDVKWASRDEVLKMIDSGEFCPYYRSLVNMIFDMQNKYGFHDSNMKIYPLEN